MSNYSDKHKSETCNDFEEDEIFDDSSFLAKFDSTSFKESRFSESNINDSINRSGLNVSALCCDEEISGYDKLTGKTWIYPTNYPVRDYQFNIIKSAILRNTLVSLPTGLGKTFIAAVIMYNFYRWYPLGKIVFTAPTRPLVAQQIEACYNIIAIPPTDTIEMTGHMQVNTRKLHWKNKRVFFATPQVIYNDIKSGICPGDKIRCLVIDEAHKARGNYAYCQIVSTLTEMGHNTYRILALSATPGSKVEDVISVVKTLHIAHLELRTENCIDVAAYSHSRKINTVVIPLGPELTQLRQQYVEILDGYARRLKQLNILPQNLGNLSKGRIVMLYKEFQTKDRSLRHAQHNYIMKDFTLLIALYHGLELLVKHGSRVFLNFFDEHPEKSWIQSDDKLTALLERLRDDLGVNPLSLDRSILPDGTIPEMPKDLCFGHPKFYRLKEIIMEHFTKAKKNGQDTRAIVFCEYRESVNLVHCLLLQCRPLITPQMFVGQGASGKEGKTVVSQKQQLRVMRAFREGGCNVLVATCVAEEGLDVGSVDLIICFDISTRSPVRLVQRCGRTGRERSGQVHILVTEGREHQTLTDCMRQRDGLNKRIQQSKEVEANLYKMNPRMMPHNHTPQCQKMFITVAAKTDVKANKQEKPKKGQKDLRSMLLGRGSTTSSSSKESSGAEFMTEQEFQELFPDGFIYDTKVEEPKELWAMNKGRIKSLNKNNENDDSKLCTWLEWQRSLQKTINIGHSKDSEILSSLLQYCDAKRFEMPASTQNPTFNTQEMPTQNFRIPSPVKPKVKHKKAKTITAKSPSKLANSPGKKDGDIRALFSTVTKSTKNYTKLINDLGLPNNGSIPTKLINLLVDMSIDNTSSDKICYICQNVCDCSMIKNIREQRNKSSYSLNFLTNLKLPEIDLIDDIDVDSLITYAKNIDSNRNLACANEISMSCNVYEAKINQKNLNISIEEYHNESKNFDLEFDFSSPEVNATEKTPEKNHISEVNNINDNFDLEFDFDSSDNFKVVDNNENKIKTEDNLKTDLDENFELGDIEDIFAESSPEENLHVENEREKKDEKADIPKETLGFFGLNSIDDIFADDDDLDENKPLESKCITNIKRETESNENKLNSEKTPDVPENPLSPSILSGRVKTITTSPILCTQGRKFQLSTNKLKPSASTPTSAVKRKLLGSPINVNSVDKLKDSMHNSKDKSMFTITQLVNMINTTGDVSLNRKSVESTVESRYVEDRSTSPILLTQADRKKSSIANLSGTNKMVMTQSSRPESLIILDSDSDASNDTINYDIKENKVKDAIKLENISPSNSPKNIKRKWEDDDKMTASPYFNKKKKLENKNSKPLSLQEKVVAALASNKVGTFRPSCTDRTVNFTFSPRKASQKENKDPHDANDNTENVFEDVTANRQKNNLEMLQIFRRDSEVKASKEIFSNLLNNDNVRSTQKRKLTFDDSDDDFVDDKPEKQKQTNEVVKKPKIQIKSRKAKHNSFLDTEVEVSDDSECSGDELSCDSAGSLAEFICDEDQSHREDMQAHYLRSVKSPVRGVFKIPELPKKYDDLEIFSQYVEEDNYEMDSFCVDSHIGLTQANEMSELELAEIVLEEKRKRKKSTKSQTVTENNGDSPIVRKKKKTRRIQSDSDDSS